MGGILVKRSGGAGGVEALKGRSRASLASQLPQGGAFLWAKKKALLSQDLFQFWCPRETVGFHIIQGLQRYLVVRDTSRDTDSFRLLHFHMRVE
jgi:hypothetical protein